MNNLTYTDKQIIEDLCLMGSGFFLNFSDRNFSDFFETVAQIDIDDPKYHEYGGSKAKRMRSFLKQAENEAVVKILSELMKLIPLRNPNYSHPMLAQLSVTVEGLKNHSKSRGKKIALAESESVWSSNKVRIFISHRDTSKKEAQALAENLNNVGFTCFVAHDTIEPMSQWKNVIESAMETMDGMICFLTADYYKSVWTNQELGFALGKGVPVYQYCHEKIDPIGFRMDIQAIRQGEEKLKSILIRDFKSHKSVRDNIFSEFLSAKDGSFAHSKKQFIKLLQIQLTDSEIEQIVDTVNGPAKSSINQLRILLSDDPILEPVKQVLKCTENTYQELLLNKVLNKHSSKKYSINNNKIS